MSDRAPAPEGLPDPADLDTPVVLYTTPWCGYCRAALTLLRLRNIAHTNVDVMGNKTARQWLREVTRQSTVPQIFVRGQSIGGYTELAELDEDGSLAMMLVDAAETEASTKAAGDGARAEAAEAESAVEAEAGATTQSDDLGATTPNDDADSTAEAEPPASAQRRDTGADV